MGRFFSNIQIQNNRNENREQFAKLFCKSMEKKGYTASTEDDASITYILTFSENNAWITLCSVDYVSGGEDVKEDVQFLAESLKTCCISTSVVDSDFAILEMYNATSNLIDMVVVGDGSGYGFEDNTEFKGKKEAWEPYLTNGGTWEQLSKAWHDIDNSAEGKLREMAKLISMDSDNIISDYDDLSCRTDKNIMELHFKKADKKKALSLNTAFKQVFGEYLEPLGFKKIKGRQPYFVRVVEGGEIIHIITYTQKPSFNEFVIKGGVATVYRQSIDLTLSAKRNGNWFRDNSWIYTHINPWNDDPESEYRKFSSSISGFSCGRDEESMIKGVEYSLEVTKDIMLPILDKITDFEACIEHQNVIGMSMHLYDDEDFGNQYGSNCYNEGLLYIKTNNQKLKKRWEKILEEKVIDETDLQQVARLYKLFSDPIVQKKVLDELEHRKKANTETLRAYGLDL